VAASKLAAESIASWPDLLNFMRIFRQRAGSSGPSKIILNSNPHAAGYTSRRPPGMRAGVFPPAASPVTQ
jgi:hypothetical protein